MLTKCAFEFFPAAIRLHGVRMKVQFIDITGHCRQGKRSATRQERALTPLRVVVTVVTHIDTFPENLNIRPGLHDRFHLPLP